MIKKVTGCARCGDTHENLEVKAFTRPTCCVDADGDQYNHFAMCPTTNEPILVCVTQDATEEQAAG